MKFDRKDCRIDIYNNFIAVSIIIYHIPTHVSVRCTDKFQYRLQERLLKELEQKVIEYV